MDSTLIKNSNIRKNVASKFTWVPIFDAVAEWISKYEDNQQELVNILRNLSDECGFEKAGFTDIGQHGRSIDLESIDPFTFFAMFMKFGEDKRKKLFDAFLKQLEKPINSPIDFDGVPTANAQRVWLFPYAKDRDDSAIPKLWKLFHQAREGSIQAEVFDEVLKISGTGFTKLTQCLFYISPAQYFPVDAQTKPWLIENGAPKITEDWLGYKELLKWLSENVKEPLYEISHKAYLERPKITISPKIVDEILTNKYPYGRGGNSELVTYKISESRELAFSLSKNPSQKKKVKLFSNARPPEEIFANTKHAKLTGKLESCCKSSAKSLVGGHDVFVTEISSPEELVEFCDWYEGVEVNNSSDGSEPKPNLEDKVTVKHPLNQILFGPAGTGKTYHTINHAVAIIDGLTEEEVKKKSRKDLKDRFDDLVGANQIRFVTFHQSFSYEDFVEGIRAQPAEKKEISFSVKPGVFKQICDEAKKSKADNNSPKSYVLIIDEINRGNISRVFGELITLIEDSKRAGASEALSVTLPYSGDVFSVPSNLYIIGTMNSSDRSLTGLDMALRRRFTFVEMPPNPQLLNGVMVEGQLDIGQLLRVMNDRIEVLLDRDHCIGHAYFMPLTEPGKNIVNELKAIFLQQIIPLLQEYFFDDWSKINLVLNRNGMLESKEIQAGLFKPIGGNEVSYLQDKKIWLLNNDAFDYIKTYKAILIDSAVQVTTGDQ